MRGSKFAFCSPLVACALAFFLADANAAPPKRIDLTTVPRTIAKEPAYQTESPGYCLLVLGLEAKTRIWLVADGDQVYIDRNGNGDLTELGERVTRKDYRGRFRLGAVTETDGKTTHEDLSIKVNEDSTFELELVSHWRIRRHVGRAETAKPKLAATPDDAPIIHPNGRLTLAPFTPINFAFRSADDDRDTQFEWLNLVAGSPGLGPGTFTAIYPVKRVGCDGDRKVLADIEFPSRVNNESIVTKQELMTEG